MWLPDDFMPGASWVLGSYCALMGIALVVAAIFAATWELA